MLNHKFLEEKYRKDTLAMTTFYRKEETKLVKFFLSFIAKTFRPPRQETPVATMASGRRSKGLDDQQKKCDQLGFFLPIKKSWNALVTHKQLLRTVIPCKTERGKAGGALLRKGYS